MLGKALPVVLLLLVAAAASAGIPPVLTLHLAPYVDKTPVIDGKLDDAIWQTAPLNTTFYKYWTVDPVASPLKTAFQLAYDDKRIYLASRMYEQDAAKIKATVTQRSDPRLWEDDCAEIYFDPAGSGTGYRKFTINALNTIDTAYRMDAANYDDTWAPEGWESGTSRDEQGWYFEMAIPWSVLVREAKDGDLWRFCLVRFSWSSGGWSNAGLVTSALGGNYNNPDRFGWILFMRNLAGADTNALAKQLETRVPGDWMVALPDSVVLKQDGKVSVTNMNALLAATRQQVAAELEANRKLVWQDEVGLKGCDQVQEELDKVATEVADPIGLQLAVGTLTKLSNQLEDIKYTHMLTELLAMG